jgi:ribosomal protein S4
MLKGSKFKLCNSIIGSYKNLWGIIKCVHYRSIRIFKKNFYKVNQKLSRLSFFGRFLNIKKCLKRFYSKKEKVFKFLIKKSISCNYKTTNKLLSFLESNIISILYRGCFVNSLYMARQLISHGHIYLNSKKIFYKNLIISCGDIIFFKNNFLLLFKRSVFKKNYKISTKKINLSKKKISKNLIKIVNNKSRNITNILKKIFLKQKKYQIFIIKVLIKLRFLSKNLESNFKISKIIFLWDPNIIYYPIKIKYKKHLNSFIYSYNEVLYQY